MICFFHVSLSKSSSWGDDEGYDMRVFSPYVFGTCSHAKTMVLLGFEFKVTFFTLLKPSFNLG